MLHRVDNAVRKLSSGFNGIAGAAVVVMMVLITSEVVLRFFRHPIPGTYEIVGLLGTVVVSFSLAYTFMERGHIVVEFLVRKLPRKVQGVVDGINDFVSLILFSLITYQCWLYGTTLKGIGEVSLTVQIPLYPFLYGISVGCGLLCLVILTDLLETVRRLRKT